MFMFSLNLLPEVDILNNEIPVSWWSTAKFQPTLIQYSITVLSVHAINKMHT
jgi:hypothetical protein